MWVRNRTGLDSKPSDPSGRMITANFYAESAEQAKVKARALYDVETLKKVEENPE